MISKSFYTLFFTFVIYLFNAGNVFADLQKNIIDKLTLTETLSFDFNQKISDKVEIGKCFIKYPLLMRCNYHNSKKKIIISNGKTVAIIKKKYKKIYYYPIKTTPLFFILKKEKIINLVKSTKPELEGSHLIVFEFIDKKTNKIKIFFDKNSLVFKGWETKDAYSNKVNFIMKNLVINNQIVDNFFKIPDKEDL